jgi:hypothetical protein
MKELATDLSAPLALVAGILICFFGQRLVKVTLGLVGFVAGGAGGWAAAGAIWPDNSKAALICILAAGAIVAMLCFWLFHLGIFIAGAGTGAVATAAVLRAMEQPVKPLAVLIAALAFGVAALLLQKFMLVLSTAFTGSYLITAAVIHFLSGVHEVHPLWFDGEAIKSGDRMKYVALGVWAILGLLGMRFQYGGKKKDKAHEAS